MYRRKHPQNGLHQRPSRSSEISPQTAVASALAATLAGVTVMLYYRTQRAHLIRTEIRRRAIGDLLKLAMEDPALDECWGPVPDESDPKTRRQLLYTNVIITEWSLSFGTRALPETRLRHVANEMFQGAVGRAYWEAARQARLSTSANRRERRFHEILDEEYQKATPAPVTERPTQGPSPNEGPR